jgi:hypothetical protein
MSVPTGTNQNGALLEHHQPLFYSRLNTNVSGML